LFLFSLETENDDENVFGWNFKNIFNENIFPNELENRNNKIQILVEYRTSAWIK